MKKFVLILSVTMMSHSAQAECVDADNYRFIVCQDTSEFTKPTKLSSQKIEEIEKMFPRPLDQEETLDSQSRN